MENPAAVPQEDVAVPYENKVGSTDRYIYIDDALSVLFYTYLLCKGVMKVKKLEQDIQP